MQLMQANASCFPGLCRVPQGFVTVTHCWSALAAFVKRRMLTWHVDPCFQSQEEIRLHSDRRDVPIPTSYSYHW